MSGTMPAPYDVLVVGAGFAGMYALHRARSAGFSVLGIEAGSDVGGTWYWNRYPGARCDVESIDYSYSFDEDLQRDWVWSERFAPQPEIHAYARHVADRFGLRELVRFGQRVVTARFDGGSSTWRVTTDAGEEHRTRFLVLATGSLSTPNRPPIPGADEFAGDVLFTAQWPPGGAALTGQRVGIIGTGSSGIQSIPFLAEQARSLTVFQRSANYSVPAPNRPHTDAEQIAIRAGYAARRAITAVSSSGSPYESYPRRATDVDDGERTAAFEARWEQGGVQFAKTFVDQTIDPIVNDLAREFVEAKIRSIVDDPRVAEDLIPDDHPIGTKRICTDSGYYETFNLPHVRLVNLRREPLTRLTVRGVETTESFYELDVLVYATGFDAMTGAVARIDLIGPRGARIQETWGEGPITDLGMAVPGFPNMFVVTGPGSPSVLANMILAAEQQVEWVVDLISHLRRSGYAQVEARSDAAEKWTAHVDDAAHATLFPQARSWYMGANIEGKRQMFMPYIGGFGKYRRICDDVAANDYEGFVLTSR